jgi:ribosomal protein S12 methylthiotransferase
VESILNQRSNREQPTTQSKGAYAFVSLGCPKNLVDSERMLGRLRLDGYQLVSDPEGADFVVVNTCGFIEQARQESYSVIDEMLDLKRRGGTRGVIVAGCLAERQKEELLESRPEIDSLVGVFARDEVVKIADRLLGHLQEQRSVFRPAPIQALSDRQRFRVTPRHFSYLKIAEGCDRLCTFCAIPRMRGKHVSKPMEEIVQEAEELAADGVRELVVVAQDTTYYGLDLYGQPRLEELLRALENVAGISWIRLMYFYPMYISDSLIATIAASPKILPYLDMPLQHISDAVLRRMSRRVTRAETETLLRRLRTGIPNLVLRTTFITGFPGETQEDWEELRAFMEEQQFQRVGIFTYSREPQTPADRLPDHVPEELKRERRDRLMELQQSISKRYNELQVGRRLPVILDQPVPNEHHVWLGRSQADAPDIDGTVYVTESAGALSAGQIVPAEIVGAQEYDLIGVAVASA